VLVANILMLGVMYLATGWIARIATIPKQLLMPSILVLCILGSYALTNSWSTVLVMLLFTVVGFTMERKRYPLAPMVIGLVLAPIAETSLRKALMYTDGAFLPLLWAPVPILCAALTVGMFVLMKRMDNNA
jgi:putative tricarboxylic transport membrane protein